MEPWNILELGENLILFLTVGVGSGGLWTAQEIWKMRKAGMTNDLDQVIRGYQYRSSVSRYFLLKNFL